MFVQYLIAICPTVFEILQAGPQWSLVRDLFILGRSWRNQNIKQGQTGQKGYYISMHNWSDDRRVYRPTVVIRGISVKTSVSI